MSKAQEIAKVYSTSTLKELRAMFPGTADDYFYRVAARHNLKKNKDVIAKQGYENSQHPKSVEHRFKKGLIPTNKGKKQCEYMSKEGIEKSSKTRFKKGLIPKNKKKLYDIRRNADGYMQIKIDENKWTNLSTFVYESMKGKVPEGCFVRSRDGNINNVNIDNLFVVSRYENLLRNHKQHHDESDEMIECRVLMNEINKQIKNK